MRFTTEMTKNVNLPPFNS